ncbi:bifunctional 5,10-methylenetetrahydrofolate dehydrogenase/5,10-methenyltetrahydrofolate cyclohydrolase [Candidatus Saccharibacteria bacterium]|nr:bifunctional 5,10-methylenetetrahydrofolate dehydrogenase/5,10-methenyltetrahydrofolate cyclohydrolase [Candidatus Saccharibacteria bacterium]
MKSLNGQELADFIKERQARQVRGLIQHDQIKPKLAIIQTVDNSVVNTYVGLKKTYGADILIDVDVYKIPQSMALNQIKKLNNDPTVHGIIVQLPIENPDEVDEILNTIAPTKDVDGLGKDAIFDPATPTAINWLLTGYDIDLKQKIAIVGNGRLVGKPLARMWRNSGLDVVVLDSKTEDMPDKLRSADIIVTATGVPGLIKSNDIKTGAVVVDAGTADAHGEVVGDVAPDVRSRTDVMITPKQGGVGPLTVAALMDNVIRAARGTIVLVQ